MLDIIRAHLKMRDIPDEPLSIEFTFNNNKNITIKCKTYPTLNTTTVLENDTLIITFDDLYLIPNQKTQLEYKE